jgi:hypothetical protein
MTIAPGRASYNIGLYAELHLSSLFRPQHHVRGHCTPRKFCPVKRGCTKDVMGPGVNVTITTLGKFCQFSAEKMAFFLKTHLMIIFSST